MCHPLEGNRHRTMEQIKEGRSRPTKICSTAFPQGCESTLMEEWCWSNSTTIRKKINSDLNLIPLHTSKLKIRSHTLV